MGDTDPLPWRRRIGLVLGPLLFFVMLSIDIDGMSGDARYVAAVALLMTSWWISEAIPIPATALLPIVLFPAQGIMSPAEVTSPYANHLVYLFLGGFLIAIAIEKYNLHRRIALRTIRTTGTSPTRILLGFMLAAAFLSMWISNTATTMMMLPVGLAVLDRVQQTSGESEQFGVVLMLGIAYACSIGGVATLIGTPPNAILAGIYEETSGHTLGFADWMGFALPISATMFIITWIFLHLRGGLSGMEHSSTSNDVIREELASLGPMSRPEQRVLLVFLLVAGTWILRGLFKPAILDGISDSTIAVAGAVLLFIVPSGNRGNRLLEWRDTTRLPWDIMVLFGGGFALASGFSDSGLTAWIAVRLSGAIQFGPAILVMAVALVVIFLTEVTSNTATASLMLPVMGALAQAAEMSPLGLMTTAAIAASFAFMLPVATPPNAIVYSSRVVSIARMARTGLVLNLVASGVLYLFVTRWLPLSPLN